MKQRNFNLEALRVVLMLLIILLHLSGQFYDVPTIRLEPCNIETSSMLGMRMIFLLGVNTFAFISGYFGIVNIRGGQIKLIKYEFLALSWGIMFAIFDALYNGHIVWRHLLDFALPSTSCVCWYFSAYMLLLVLSPIVNMGVDFLSKKYFSLALVFIIAIEFFGGTLYRVNGTTFMQLFYIYLIGRYLKKYPIAIVEKYSMHVFFLAMSFNVVLVFLCSYFQLGCDSLLRMIENNRNPLVLLSSICLFMMVKNRKEIRITKWLAKLAPYMFSVYISHVYLLYLNLINFKALIVGNALISMFVYSFLLLIVCIVLDKIRLFFFGGILNRLETSLTSLILKQ